MNSQQDFNWDWELELDRFEAEFPRQAAPQQHINDDLDIDNNVLLDAPLSNAFEQVDMHPQQHVDSTIDPRLLSRELFQPQNSVGGWLAQPPMAADAGLMSAMDEFTLPPFGGPRGMGLQAQQQQQPMPAVRHDGPGPGTAARRAAPQPRPARRQVGTRRAVPAIAPPGTTQKVRRCEHRMRAPVRYQQKLRELDDKVQAHIETHGCQVTECGRARLLNKKLDEFLAHFSNLPSVSQQLPQQQ